MTPKRLPGRRNSDENPSEVFWSDSRDPPQRYSTFDPTTEDALYYSPGQDFLVTRPDPQQMRQRPASVSQNAYNLESTSMFENNESLPVSGYNYYANAAYTDAVSLSQSYHHSQESVEWNGNDPSQQFPTGSGYSSPAQTPRRLVPTVRQPAFACNPTNLDYPTHSPDDTSEPGHNAANYFEGSRPVNNLVLPDKKRLKLGAGSQTSTPGVTASPQIGSDMRNSPELLYADQTSPKRDFSNVQKPPSTVATSLSSSPVGYIYLTDIPHKYRFECRQPECDATFGRHVDLDRHYNAYHAQDKTEYWCTVEGCDRSEGGNKPFARKDKLKDHLRQGHKIG